MKRAVFMAGFAVFGLFSTWSGILLTQRINWSELFRASPVACEIDHCQVPTHVLVEIALLLLSPTVCHAIVGWRLHQPITSQRLAATALALWVGSFVFFLVAAVAQYRVIPDPHCECEEGAQLEVAPNNELQPGRWAA